MIRVWGSAILLALLLPSVWSLISHPSAFGGSFETVFLFLLVLLLNLILPYTWRRTARQAAKSVRGYSIEITLDAVELKSAYANKRILRNEIIRIDEARWGSGLYVRTANPFRWILIPRRIQGFDEIKATLAANGIPTARTAISPAWQGQMFLVLFCGSLMCDVFATSRNTLLANLGVAFLIGIYGLVVFRSVMESALRLKARLGSLIPLVGAGLALLFQVGRF